MNRSLLFAATLGVLHLFASAAPVRVDAQFPGGNVRVEKVAGDTVFVAPDLRDTQQGQWWFYWNFRIRGEAGQTVTVVFRDRNPIGVRGPAWSIDGGVTWKWMGADTVKEETREGRKAWSFAVPLPESGEARVAFCVPHTQAVLDEHLRQFAEHPALRREVLTRSRKGRDVELLRAGNLENPEKVILVTSRHHACETMGTYAMEGIIGAVLADDDSGRKWRQHWQLIAIPFVDKDGVEDGDQGKNRHPRDHNRSYQEPAIYPETKAIMELGRKLGDHLAVALDLHCPWIRGTWNDRVYFVGAADERAYARQVAFAQTLERVQTGPIKFRSRDCLPFGTAWNTDANFAQGRSFGNWARSTFPKAELVNTVEIAYADAHGDEVTAASARALGRDIGRALVAFLERPAE